MRRVEYFLKETLQAFRRNGFVVFAAISTAFIALFLLGGAILVQREVNKIAQSVEANVEVSVFLADEPTGNLDPATTVGIMRILDRINRTGTTIVMATHDQRIVDAMRRRVIELDRGSLVRDQARGVYGVGS